MSEDMPDRHDGGDAQALTLSAFEKSGRLENLKTALRRAEADLLNLTGWLPITARARVDRMAAEIRQAIEAEEAADRAAAKWPRCLNGMPGYPPARSEGEVVRLHRLPPKPGPEAA